MSGPDDPSHRGWSPPPGETGPAGEPPRYPPLGPPPQYPDPNQYPPNQYPPNQYPPNQYPPPQYPSPQYPPPQYPPSSQPPPFPPGQYPPAGFGPGGVPAMAGPYGVPPPRKSRLRWVLIAGGVIVVLIVAVVVAAAVLTRGSITNIDDASVGDCITVSGSKDDAKPKTADCDSQEFTFVIADKFNDLFVFCGGAQYARLTQKDRGTLCLVPNMRVGKCYVLPGENGSITDFAETDCAGTPRSSGDEIIRVLDRQPSTDVEDCTTGGVLSFAKPTPLSYCAEVLTPQ